MFFIKTEIAGGVTLRTEIMDGENTFTVCPDCGSEHAVSLMELTEDGRFDLYGTSICCLECSEKRQNARKPTKMTMI